jgi:hypothetical protein
MSNPDLYITYSYILAILLVLFSYHVHGLSLIESCPYLFLYYVVYCLFWLVPLFSSFNFRSPWSPRSLLMIYSSVKLQGRGGKLPFQTVKYFYLTKLSQLNRNLSQEETLNHVLLYYKGRFESNVPSTVPPSAAAIYRGSQKVCMHF